MPSKYRATYANRAKKFLSEGRSKRALASELKVCVKTIFRWGEAHPEFAEALAVGKEASYKWWEDLVREEALKGNPGIIALAMANMFGWHGASSKRQGEDDGPVQIQIVQMQETDRPNCHDKGKDEIDTSPLIYAVEPPKLLTDS